jgi:hypothetical protein
MTSLVSWNSDSDLLSSEWSEFNESIGIDIIIWKLTSLDNLSIVVVDPFSFWKVLESETIDGSLGTATVSDFLKNHGVNTEVLVSWEFNWEPEIVFVIRSSVDESSAGFQEDILFTGPVIIVSGTLLRSGIEVHDGSVGIRVFVWVFLTSSIIVLIFIFFLLNDYNINSSADESITGTSCLSTWEVNSDFVGNELFIDVNFSFDFGSIVLVLACFKESSFFIGRPDTIDLVIKSESVNDILLLAFVAFESVVITSLLNDDLLNLGWFLELNLDPEIFLLLSGSFTVVETELGSKFSVGPFFTQLRLHGDGSSQLTDCSLGIW